MTKLDELIEQIDKNKHSQFSRDLNARDAYTKFFEAVDEDIGLIGRSIKLIKKWEKLRKVLK